MNPNPFDTRRQVDPQGLIDDLVAQTTRQAQAINALNKEIENFKALLDQNNIPIPAEPVKKGKKK